MNNKGEATAAILLVVALVGGLAYFFGPKVLHGDSRRASSSAAATAAVEEAANAQGSAAAASVVKIGEANSVAPTSPARDFISKEVPVALSYLPAPDPEKLLEAERRRSAVMEGRLDEARRLYETSAKQAARMQEERDRALAQRRAVDMELVEVAAARRAAERQRMALIAIAVLLGAAWVYAKVFSITPATLGRIAADVRAGGSPIAAMDANLAPWLHANVRKASQLATTPKDV